MTNETKIPLAYDLWIIKVKRTIKTLYLNCHWSDWYCVLQMTIDQYPTVDTPSAQSDQHHTPEVYRPITIHPAAHGDTSAPSWTPDPTFNNSFKS